MPRSTRVEVRVIEDGNTRLRVHCFGTDRREAYEQAIGVLQRAAPGPRPRTLMPVLDDPPEMAARVHRVADFTDWRTGARIRPVPDPPDDET